MSLHPARPMPSALAACARKPRRRCLSAPVSAPPAFPSVRPVDGFPPRGRTRDSLSRHERDRRTAATPGMLPRESISRFRRFAAPATGRSAVEARGISELPTATGFPHLRGRRECGEREMAPERDPAGGSPGCGERAQHVSRNGEIMSPRRRNSSRKRRSPCRSDAAFRVPYEEAAVIATVLVWQFCNSSEESD